MLENLQRDFQRYLLQQAPMIQTAIVNTESVPATVRLDIYRHAYYARLLEVFQLDYPTVQALLSDDEFQRLGRRYIEANPSRFRSIRWFGDNLAAFMEQTEPYMANMALIETARFEWILAEAFDAMDEPVMSLEEMASVPIEQWADMTFVLQATVKRVDFSWNVLALWQQASQGETLQPECYEMPIPHLIWRNEYVVQFCSLQPDEAYMLDAMSAGTNFGDICAGLCEWLQPEGVANHAASLLKRYIIDGVIHQVNVHFTG